MAASLQFTFSNPIEGMDAEYNRWYGTEHLPHGVLVPGVLAGQRFMRADVGPWPRGKHRYLMIWEFDDPAFALASLADVKGGTDLPLSPAIDMAGIQPPTMWRRAQVRNAARIVTDTSSRKTVLVAMLKAEEGREGEFEARMIREALPALADLKGVIAADFLTLAEQQIRNNARKFPFAVMLELADEAAALAALAAPSDRIAGLPLLDRERFFAAVFRPLGARMTSAEARGQAA